MFTGKCRHNAELNQLASSNPQKPTTTAFDLGAQILNSESDVSAAVPESPTESISSKFMRRLRLLKDR